MPHKTSPGAKARGFPAQIRAGLFRDLQGDATNGGGAFPVPGGASSFPGRDLRRGRRAAAAYIRRRREPSNTDGGGIFYPARKRGTFDHRPRTGALYLRAAFRARFPRDRRHGGRASGSVPVLRLSAAVLRFLRFLRLSAAHHFLRFPAARYDREKRRIYNV